MNILGHMEAAHEAMREVEWRLTNANICTTIVDWRLIDDVYAFHSAIVYDEDVGFCTLIGTLDDGYHIRDIQSGIELWHTYDDLVIADIKTELRDLFLSKLSKEELKEIVINKMERSL
jgi:hypothetical protein